MGIKQAIDIDSKQKKELLTLFNTYLPNTKIWAYGSRVKWSAKPSSDLDLVAFSKSAQASAVSKLKDALVESNLPFKVDLLTWDNIPNSFQVNIKENYFELQSDKQEGLPSGWRVVELGDVIITNESNYNIKDNWDVVNYLDTGNITENNISSIQSLKNGVDKIPSRAKRKVKVGDIVYSTVRPNQRHYGIIKKSYNNLLVSTGFTTIRAIDLVAYTSFIYWFLTQNRIVTYLQTIGENSASTYPSIKSTDIERLKISLPPLPEQKAIAHILGKLDDKIELNRQINQTLETMAQTLFKSWFVNFDPVIDNAIKAGNPIPDPLKPQAQKRKTTKSTLPKTTQDLFPNSFVFNHKLNKWIPEGWAVTTIEELSTIIGGGTPSTKIKEYFCKNGIAWLSPKDLSNYGWKYVEKGKIDITKLGLQKSSAKLVPKGTVLFSSRAPIGYMAIAENEICTNQGFKSLVPNKGIPTEYLFQFLKLNTGHLKSLATGSTFAEISSTILKGISIIEPPVSVLELLKFKVKSINNQNLLNQKQTQTLTKLRDTLLPKLISGKIRVSQKNQNEKII